MLVGIVVGALLVDLHFARGLRFGYDEAWHVFASTVHPLSQLPGELRMEAHPPLHYLVLRLMSPLGGSEIWLRLASIVPGLATIVLTYVCAQTLRVARPVALLTTLAVALAPAHINMAVCVRAYSLATALTLLAFWPFLRIVRDPIHAAPRDRLAFAVAGVLAMATEYSAVMAIVAAVIVLAAAWLLDRVPFAQRVRALGGWLPAVSVLAVGALSVVLYRRWADIGAYNHLGEFFPAAGEQLLHFAIVGAGRALSLLLCPMPIDGSGTALLTVAAGTAGSVALLTRHLASRSPKRDLARAAVLLVHLLLWVMLLVLAYVGLYPYGGRLRQQFVIFPFLLLSGAVALDALHGGLGSRLRRRALVAGVAAAILVGSWRGLAVPLEEFMGGAFWPQEIAAARAMLAADDALFTRQFNQVGVFTNTSDWRWILREHLGPQLDRFTVKRRDERFTLIRDRTWTVPMPPTAEFVADLARLLRTTNVGGLVVLALPQGNFDRTAAAQPSAPMDLALLARAEGLVLTDHLIFDAGIVFRVVTGNR